MRVGIIGAGGVGVELVNYLLTMGNMSEIVLVNRNKDKAWAEIEDFSYVSSFTYARNTHLHYGDYHDCTQCDVIVITAGAQLKGNQTRDELLGENATLIRTIIHELYWIKFSCVAIISLIRRWFVKSMPTKSSECGKERWVRCPVPFLVFLNSLGCIKMINLVCVSMACT